MNPGVGTNSQPTNWAKSTPEPWSIKNTAPPASRTFLMVRRWRTVGILPCAFVSMAAYMPLWQTWKSSAGSPIPLYAPTFFSCAFTASFTLPSGVIGEYLR